MSSISHDVGVRLAVASAVGLGMLSLLVLPTSPRAGEVNCSDVGTPRNYSIKEAYDDPVAAFGDPEGQNAVEDIPAAKLKDQFVNCESNAFYFHIVLAGKSLWVATDAVEVYENLKGGCGSVSSVKVGATMGGGKSC